MISSFLILPFLATNIDALLRLDLETSNAGCAALSCLQGFDCCTNEQGAAYCCQPGTIPVESNDICALPAATGNCRGAIPRYYYDSEVNECRFFTYGGCGGNENNFRSRRQCRRQCGSQSTAQPEDICSQPAVTGPCKAAFPRYFYNPQSGECESFIYGGCQGNDNNFLTLSDCQNQCDQQEPDICSLPSMTGLCKAYIPRYFYNSESGECEEFIYGGCHGNGNNFEKLEECQTRCGPKTTTKSPIYIVPNDFDWNRALLELQRRRDLWINNGFTKYRYNEKKFCFCASCDIAGKYIEIKDGVATDVEFDTEAQREYGCDATDVSQPIDARYSSIVQLFDRAISHALRGLNAACIDDPNNGNYAEPVCGGFAEIQYDEVLHYPTKIALGLDPRIADGNIIYFIDCLTPIHVNGQSVTLPISGYHRECPTASCGEIGDDCSSKKDCCDSECAPIHGRMQCSLE